MGLQKELDSNKQRSTALQERYKVELEKKERLFKTVNHDKEILEGKIKVLECDIQEKKKEIKLLKDENDNLSESMDRETRKLKKEIGEWQE